MPMKNIRVSVSQLGKYKRCELMWWNEYGPLKIKPPPKPNQALGSDVHKCIEDYMLEGTPFPKNKAGRIASAGLDKLPDPNSVEIEKNFTMPLTSKSNILCRIDLMGKDRAYIADHKTTKDFKWAKTRSELESDVQLLTYAYAAYHETKPHEVDVELIYYRTTGMPVSMKISNTVSWEAIQENWEAIGEIADEMAGKVNDPTGENCKPNTSACKDFGGCFHAPNCPFANTGKKSPKTFTELIKNDYNRTAKPKNSRTQETTKGKNEMPKTAEEVQIALGILSPDAPPEVLQTEALLNSVAKKYKELLDVFDSVPIPFTTVSQFFIKHGVSEDKIPFVVERAEELGNNKDVEMELEQGGDVFNFTNSNKKRKCDNDALHVYARQLAKEFPRGCTYDIFEKRIKEILAPNKVTDSRRQRLLEYSGVQIVSNKAAAFVEEPTPTPKPAADLDRAEYEKKSGRKAPVATQPAVETLEELDQRVNPRAAIANNLVVLVDCLFASGIPSNAVPFNLWVKPYIDKVEAMQKQQLFMLDLDYGKGTKFLVGVITSAFNQDAPQGLITMSSDDAHAKAILPLFIRAGATVIR